MIPALARRDGAFRVNAWSTLRGEQDIYQQAMQQLKDLNLAERAGTVAGR